MFIRQSDGAEAVSYTHLKMNWHGKQERQALVGIYDAAGEVITESQRDAELVYYMKYMDGVIYMIEPDRTGLKKGLTNQYLCIRNEDIDAYYERARMLSVEEQSLSLIHI